MNSSFEAERRICAVAMHRNDWVEEADLRIDQFEAAQFGNLYATIKRMVLAGQSANPATLQISMKDAASFTELQSLYNETSPGTKKAFLSLAKAIQDASGRRELKRAIQDALALVTDTSESPLTLLAQVEELVRGVDAGSGSKMLTLRDHALGVAKAIGDPSKRGLMTGWDALDKRLGGFMPGNLIVIAGRPGGGKSSFGLNLARIWGQNGFAGHVASYEMGSAQLGERIIGAMGDLDYSQIRREPDRFNATDIEAIAMTAPDNVVADPTSAQSLAQLEMSARATKRKFGLDFIIVDYLQLMQGQAKGSAQERVAEVSKGLKSLAIRLGVPIVALCQINRSAESREGNRPQLGDMRESGAIEQDADIVLGMYREAYYLAQQKPDEANQQEFRDWAHKYAACRNVLEVLTLKNRMGPTGTDKLAIYLERDRIESFTGPALVPSRRMGRDYE
jgi:replicative DNA helicase